MRTEGQGKAVCRGMGLSEGHSRVTSGASAPVHRAVRSLGQASHARGARPEGGRRSGARGGSAGRVRSSGASGEGCWSDSYIGKYMVNRVLIVVPGGWVKVGPGAGGDRGWGGSDGRSRGGSVRHPRPVPLVYIEGPRGGHLLETEDDDAGAVGARASLAGTPGAAWVAPGRSGPSGCGRATSRVSPGASGPARRPRGPTPLSRPSPP